MHARRNARLFAFALALAAFVSACNNAPPPKAHSPYASAEDVELNFRAKTFILGDDDTVAEVRAPSWNKDHFLRLPFWVGVNILVPGVTQPVEGNYYVISEAVLGRATGTRGEWFIDAGSTLVKQQAVFVTSRTVYEGEGKILPTVVQYMGMRSFKRFDGSSVDLPVLREVSLPMKWTLGGRIPATYAHFKII